MACCKRTVIIDAIRELCGNGYANVALRGSSNSGLYNCVSHIIHYWVVADMYIY